MKSKFRFCCSGIVFALAANTVQADLSLDTPDHSLLLSQQLTQIGAPPQQTGALGYLSLNQNKRLQLGEGLSFDSVIPSIELTENTRIQGFSRLNEEEQHLAVGVRFGDNLLNIMTGRGEGFSRLSNQYADIDPYYFHGGTTAEYQFNNVEWMHQLNDDIMLQIGQASIEADHLERRDTRYIGASLGHFNAHYMQVQRSQDSVGETLSLGYDAAFGQVDWSALRHQAGGLSQQLSISLNASSRNQYGFSFGSQRNPLIEEDTQYRVLFRFTRAFGQRNRMQADETAETHRPKINKYVIIGGAAVAAGLALSSGSDNQDSALRLSDQHAAAKQVLNRINPVSVRENREYGGWIYRTPDDRYTSTAPIKGQLASIRIPLDLIPAGGTALASYHTHGSADPRFVNEQFSPTDISSNESFGVDGYLGTPGAKFLWYDHRKNKIVLLGSIAN